METVCLPQPLAPDSFPLPFRLSYGDCLSPGHRLEGFCFVRKLRRRQQGCPCGACPEHSTVESRMGDGRLCEDKRLSYFSVPQPCYFLVGMGEARQELGGQLLFVRFEV